MSESATPSPPQPFSERLSDRLQQIVQAVVGSHQPPPRRLKTLLNGTWLGHPLHPVITDVPVTSWILTALFDIIWLISNSIAANASVFTTLQCVVSTSSDRL